MDETSLDDFLEGNAEDSEAGPAESDTDEKRAETASEAATKPAGEAGGETDENGTPAHTARVDPATVEPAQPTHQWTPDGAVCGVCGQVVNRRWEAAAGLVCADCKDW